MSTFRKKILFVAVSGTFAISLGGLGTADASTVQGGVGLVAALTQTLGLGSAVTQYGDSNNIASGPGSAAGTNDTAVGVNATSTGTNSVALGYNSSDGGQSNVVAVGSATQQRKIILKKAVTARPEQESPHLVTTVIG